MNNEISDFIFLTSEQLYGKNQLEVLKKYGTIMSVTDFSILLGADIEDNHYSSEGASLKNRSGYYFSSSCDSFGNVYAIGVVGTRTWYQPYKRNFTARPALAYFDISLFPKNSIKKVNEITEIEYGEYPQMAVPVKQSSNLELLYSQNNLVKTGKVYTTDSIKNNDYKSKFVAIEHEEFEYNGKKYIRVISDNDIHGNGNKRLSNSLLLSDLNKKPIWIEVQPIKWLVDEQAKVILSKKGIFSGIRFSNDIYYNGNFMNTDIKKFMNDYFSKDIVSSKHIQKNTQVFQKDNHISKNFQKINPYNFDFGLVSEEDIIRGAIQSGIAVFLHGQSSEGKSARVKQLDPNLEIIYLRNATPDSLNGKSVYNSETGEMIDIPPTWYKKIKEKCDLEPNKIHIIFFDEITNALPAIQGMAYNIVLDREVNGIWKLPNNARVVAAGNDYNDSLAANQLAEPLFNRFVHVYIHTSVEDWLKWAMTADNINDKLDYEEKKTERKIHPSIYAYIAFKRDAALRSSYTGIKPNADPRKWEMASLLLYKTGKPEMLRGLIGDDLTRDFIHFCNQQVLTLEDVILDNYDVDDLEMPTDRKWATVVGLSCVDEENVEKVRDFVSKLEPELISIFDSLWMHGNARRMEIISELRLSYIKIKKM